MDHTKLLYYGQVSPHPGSGKGNPVSAQPSERPASTVRIVVDWGSSNFRAYRFGADGSVADRHQADAGILTVKDGRYEEVLEREIGGWFGPGASIMLSGMITSRNGWVETPYASTPATLSALAAGAVLRQSARGAQLKFLPGVATRLPGPDVMRGEEIQVFGVINPGESATVVLPGTHSKWTEVRDGAITGFRTFLTGETYALLKNHSIVGRLIPPGDAAFDEAAFLEGVKAVQGDRSISLLNDVFMVRAGALLGEFAVEAIADRLSGMVIGHELRAGLGLHRGGRIILIGEAALTARYALALDALGVPAEIGPAHAAVEGFRRLSALEGQ